MSGHEVQFMGGLLHGEMLVVPDEGYDEPPETLLVTGFRSSVLLPPTDPKDVREVIEMSQEILANMEEMIEVDQTPIHLTYQRQVSSLDEGPLWVYVLEVDEPVA